MILMTHLDHHFNYLVEFLRHTAITKGEMMKDTEDATTPTRPKIKVNTFIIPKCFF